MVVDIGGRHTVARTEPATSRMLVGGRRRRDGRDAVDTDAGNVARPA